ncbi:MAG: ECF transporter S component [Bacillota bacterium]|nr:ECF transporter S component [Bacillota bacterium]
MKIGLAQKVTRTALLLAILLAMQYFKNLSQFITGPGVNLVLIIATLSIGLRGGIFFGIVSPFTSWIMAKSIPMPMLLTKGSLAVVVIAGNLALVLSVWLFTRGKKSYQGKMKNLGMVVVGIIVGCIVKWLVMWGGVDLIVLPLFPQLPQKVGSTVLVMFTHLQLITAAIGGAIAMVIWKPLEKLLIKK